MSIIKLNTKSKFKNKRKSRLTNRYIYLENPIEFSENVGHQLFIDLVRKRRKSRGKFSPEFLVLDSLSPSEDRILATRPYERTVSSLDDSGFKLIVPRNASSAPALIGAEYTRNDLGLGTLQISSTAEFTKALKVNIEFKAEDLIANTPSSAFDLRFNGEPVTTRYLRRRKNGNELHQIQVSGAGLLTIFESDPFATTSTEALSNSRTEGKAENWNSDLTQKSTTFATAQAVGPLPSDPCVGYVNSIMASAQNFYTIAGNNGAAYFPGCVALNPNVHIVIFETTNTGNRVSIASDRIQNPFLTRSHRLQTIEAHALSRPNSFFAINGFIWDGSDGVAYLNGTGDFIGTRIADGDVKQSARPNTTAEAIIAFDDDAGATNLASFIQKPAGTNAVLGSFNFNVIGSTSSITNPSITINNGCNSSPTNPGASEPRSSIGLRTDPVTGRQFVVALSSSTQTAATANDFCQVFRALDVNSAIVLDGNSAAGLWFNGIHRNPLDGFTKTLVGGGARKIISALTVSGRF